jgi:predicted XRE-type DNA-binding protein
MPSLPEFGQGKLLNIRHRTYGKEYLVIKQRLEELGLEQRELAAAAEVTESYISQLLTRKKLPPRA